MKYQKWTKLLFYLALTGFLGVNSLNINALPHQWALNSTGCNSVDGNIDMTLNNVYLGAGSVVPPEVLIVFPQASARWLEDWKTQMVGLKENEQKSIKIDKANAYTDPTNELFGKDLFFDIEIVDIPTGETITTRISVVSVLYTLYIDCVDIISSIPVSTSSEPAGPDNTIVIGGIVIGGLIAISGLGLYIARSDKKHSSDEQLKTVTKRQEAQMQNLKKTLDQYKGSKSGKISPDSAKKPSSRHRRRRR